jgi:hypothetical protein
MDFLSDFTDNLAEEFNLRHSDKNFKKAYAYAADFYHASVSEFADKQAIEQLEFLNFKGWIGASDRTQEEIDDFALQQEQEFDDWLDDLGVKLLEKAEEYISKNEEVEL